MAEGQGRGGGGYNPGKVLVGYARVGEGIVQRHILVPAVQHSNGVYIARYAVKIQLMLSRFVSDPRKIKWAVVDEKDLRPIPGTIYKKVREDVLLRQIGK